MKHLFILYFILGCFACNNKEISLQQTPTGPVVSFAKDTLYVREKDPNNIHGNGIFHVQTLPAGRQLHLRFYDSSGQIRFSYRGQALANDQPVIVSGEWNEIFCTVNRAGLYAVTVSLKDQIGRVHTKQLMIQAAAAQRPKASLTWKVDERDPAARRYYFDAGGCLQPFGKIISYHYSISGQNILSSSDKLQYIFHQKGSYPISFYVKDDLGQHSDTLHSIIDVL
jgi:hypothetical protein